jgi:hypothetical protein
MAIQIEIGLRQNKGFAMGGGERFEGRSIAEAMSLLLVKLAKNKAFLGQPWECPENGLRGVVGQSGKRRARREWVNVAELDLVGGTMGRE